jgi:hypothetical protein
MPKNGTVGHAFGFDKVMVSANQIPVFGSDFLDYFMITARQRARFRRSRLGHIEWNILARLAADVNPSNSQTVDQYAASSAKVAAVPAISNGFYCASRCTFSDIGLQTNGKNPAG